VQNRNRRVLLAGSEPYTRLSKSNPEALKAFAEHLFAVVDVVSGLLHTNTLACVRAANRRTGESKNRRMQRAFAAHLRHVGKAYPGGEHRRVVLIIDNAPWRRGRSQCGTWAACWTG
jgi:hypothetical protein